MARRVRPISHPVAVTLDGERIIAERGEPLAATLIANDALVVARSPKFHRPRGPSCFRGGCDGCLARVNGAPNAMTCSLPAEEGTTIETQNRLGSRETDLLRATDWFFPEGLNHHELFAGIPGVQGVMQAFARRVAGLGRLPAAVSEVPRSSRREVDVLVVGSGPSGMAAAVLFHERGRKVEVVDDALEAGGILLALGRRAAAYSSLVARFDKARAEGLRFRPSTTALGVYGDDVLVASHEGAELIVAKNCVLATGAHDGVLAFEGNDVPGVVSVRAAALLLGRGILIADRIAILAPDGPSDMAQAFMDEVASLDLSVDVTVVEETDVSVKGSSRVRGLSWTSKGKKSSLDVGAVLVDAPKAPAFELAEQAGARLIAGPAGFFVDAPDGSIRDRMAVVGEVAGHSIAVDAVLALAEKVARA